MKTLGFTLSIIFPYAVTLSLVGLLESLLTATIVDETTDTKGDMNREVRGQGLANMVAGFFGGMAGCAMIGQSVINMKSGGRKRLSTLVAGLFLLFLILVLGDVVMAIPMAALVGVMIMVSVSTFEWHAIKQMPKVPLVCNIEMIVTMIIVVATHNLAYGVIAGIAVSAIAFAAKITDISASEHVVEHDGMTFKVYRINGQVYFASTTKFLELFDYDNNDEHVIIDFKYAHVWDHSAIVAIKKAKDRLNAKGKQVSIVGMNRESSDKVNNLYDDVIVH